MERNKNIVIDIDGCMNNYPYTWIKFAEDHLKQPFDNLEDLKDTISYSSYKQLKTLYRKSIYKHNALAIPEMIEFIDKHKNEFFIHIITARHKNPEMINKTVEWLKNNNIYYDYIDFVDKLHNYMLYYTPENTSLIIDDNLKILQTAYNKDIDKVFIEHNDNFRLKYEGIDEDNISVISCPSELKNIKIRK